MELKCVLSSFILNLLILLIVLNGIEIVQLQDGVRGGRLLIVLNGIEIRGRFAHHKDQTALLIVLNGIEILSFENTKVQENYF